MQIFRQFKNRQLAPVPCLYLAIMPLKNMPFITSNVVSFVTRNLAHIRLSSSLCCIPTETSHQRLTGQRTCILVSSL